MTERGKSQAAMKRHQAGFSIVTAIFLVVVFGLLGAYMVAISGVQRTTTTFALQGARAYQAAASGIQWGIRKAFSDTAPTCGGAADTPTTNTFGLSGTALAGFSVDVTCEYTYHKEKGDCFHVFLVAAKSEFGSFGDPDYVSRELQATATDQRAPTTVCP